MTIFVSSARTSTRALRNFAVFKDISFEIDGPCRNSRESLKGGGSKGSCDDAIGFWLSPRVPLGAGVSLRGDPTDGGPKYCVGLDVMNSSLWSPSSCWAS